MSQLKVLKVLGVTVTNDLSLSLHVQNVITTCAPTLYALRVLRAHGLCDSALQIIFSERECRLPSVCRLPVSLVSSTQQTSTSTSTSTSGPSTSTSTSTNLQVPVPATST